MQYLYIYMYPTTSPSMLLATYVLGACAYEATRRKVRAHAYAFVRNCPGTFPYVHERIHTAGSSYIATMGGARAKRARTHCTYTSRAGSVCAFVHVWGIACANAFECVCVRAHLAACRRVCACTQNVGSQKRGWRKIG